LNILTAENFEKIRVELLELASKSSDCCDKLVSFILEKSWTEPKFTKTYAQLCSFLLNSTKLNFNSDPAKESKKANYFKNCLLQKIQDVFEGEEDIMKSKQKYDEMTADEQSAF